MFSVGECRGRRHPHPHSALRGAAVLLRLFGGSTALCDAKPGVCGSESHAGISRGNRDALELLRQSVLDLQRHRLDGIDAMKIVPLYTSNGDVAAYLSYPHIYNPLGEWIGFCTREREVYSVLGNYVGYLSDDQRILRQRSSSVLAATAAAAHQTAQAHPAGHGSPFADDARIDPKHYRCAARGTGTSAHGGYGRASSGPGMSSRAREAPASSRDSIESAARTTDPHRRKRPDGNHCRRKACSCIPHQHCAANAAGACQPCGQCARRLDLEANR